MTILITGGGGFIGSHLANYLLTTTEHELILFDDFSTGRQKNIEHLKGDRRVTIQKQDIRNDDAVTAAVEKADQVYHLAAAVGVKKIVDNPLSSMRTNLRGTENVLEAAATDRTPTFVASSSEVYGKSEDVPFREDDDRVLGPTTTTRWGYATAKAADEFLALAHHEENELPVVVGRFFNIVGPRQSGEYGMVIPRFVEQALAGEQLTVYGDGTQTRSFTHVEDAVSAVQSLLSTDEAHGEIFNIGTPQPITINELAEKVIEQTDSDSEIEHIPFEQVYGEDFEEPTKRIPDTTKLEATLSQFPNTDLDQIINDVVRERERER